MPRTRPDDFSELAAMRGQKHPWARFWRHRDGTVTSRHYDGNTGRLIITLRHGKPRGPFRDSRPTKEA